MGIEPNRELVNHILIRKSNTKTQSKSGHDFLKQFKHLSFVKTYDVQVKVFRKTSEPSLSKNMINVS